MDIGTIIILHIFLAWFDLLFICLTGIPATRNATHGVNIVCIDLAEMNGAGTKTIHEKKLIDI